MEICDFSLRNEQSVKLFLQTPLVRENANFRDSPLSKIHGKSGNLKIRSSTESRIHGFTDLQIHGFTDSFYLSVNKYTILVIIVIDDAKWKNKLL